MAELLLELLTEDIPARMQKGAAEGLERLVSGLLRDARLSPESCESFATPRRLTLMVRGLPRSQPDLTEERRGPRVGAPDKAIQGFLKSVGLSLDQCDKRQTPKGEFYFARIERRGRSTADVLPPLLADGILQLPWPKSMRWSHTGFRFVRPLHQVLAIFDGVVLSGGLFLGDEESDVGYREDGAPNRDTFLGFRGRTRGHRFLAPKEFSVKSVADYRRKLEKAYVRLDPGERRAIIARDAEKLAVAEGLTVREDAALLDEVTGLVEWPVVLIADIHAGFMDLPEEVLTTAMRSQQKYFSLLDESGRLAPRFIVVANMVASDGGRAIVKGNERVLRARLADAKFFWEQDQKKTLFARVEDLREVIFQNKLGTMFDKVERIEKTSIYLSTLIPGADEELVRRASRLLKADLTTGMVGEFAELQGVMGRYYALHDGENDAVASAIAEHYSPLGPSDRCPTSPVSVVTALADKVDSLAGFFLIGERPTGSKDPYALRRAALGVIRLIVDNGLRLPLRSFFARALENYPRALLGSVEETTTELLGFFADRLKVHLRERGVRHDLISAVFALGDEDDLVRLLARVDALEEFLGTDDGANLLVAYRRATNIVRIEEQKDGTSYADIADDALLEEKEEGYLYRCLGEVHEGSLPAVKKERFTDAMASLATLRMPVDDFFDRVTVNCDDPRLRENRLRLLSQIRATLETVADFSRIEG